MVKARHILICLALLISRTAVICDSACDFKSTDLYEIIGSRAADVAVGLISIAVPGAGLISPIFWSILDIKNAASPLDNLASCIEEEIKKKMADLSGLKIMSKIHGYESTFNGLCMGQDRTVCTRTDTKTVSKTRDNNIWIAITLLATRMKETAADFRTAQHEYQSPLYYFLPTYASKHFVVYQMIISFSKKMDRSSETKKYRELMVKMIKYYAEIIFRYWRKARDNKCSWDQCIEDAPFFKYIDEWKELAKAINTPSSNLVANYIDLSLESLKIKTGHEVAFRSTRHLTGNEKMAYGRNRNKYSLNWFHTNSGYGWVSCAGKKGAWCYFRDCPQKYFVGLNSDDCGGEKFILHTSGTLHHNQRIGLEYGKGYWLSNYVPRWCEEAMSRGKSYKHCRNGWWATKRCPYNQEGCETEKLRLNKLGGSPGSIIRNGDIVDIWWDSSLPSIGGTFAWWTEISSMVQGPFQIIRVSNQPETNKWTKTPSLPDG